jgi:hypothetical protein
MVRRRPARAAREEAMAGVDILASAMYGGECRLPFADLYARRVERADSVDPSFADSSPR